MKKLATAAGLVALVLGTPAFADGGGGSASHDRSNPAFNSGAKLKQLSAMLRLAMLTQPGSSPGRHFGWSHGRHWGWFKPHNPHWPHEPPKSP